MLNLLCYYYRINTEKSSFLIVKGLQHENSSELISIHLLIKKVPSDKARQDTKK